jgi:hypothetical protein
LNVRGVHASAAIRHPPDAHHRASIEPVWELRPLVADRLQECLQEAHARQLQHDCQSAAISPPNAT